MPSWVKLVQKKSEKPKENSKGNEAIKKSKGR